MSPDINPTREGKSQQQRLQELLDKDAIRDVLCRYARGVDRLDVELASSVYFDGAIDHHGGFYGPGREFVAKPRALEPEWKFGHHAMAQSLIELSGDTAFVETYFVYSYQRFDATADRSAKEEKFGFMIGRYLDRMERRDGEWRIAFRRVVLDGSHAMPKGEEFPGTDKFVQGLRGPGRDEVFHPERLVDQGSRPE